MPNSMSRRTRPQIGRLAAVATAAALAGGTALWYAQPPAQAQTAPVTAPAFAGQAPSSFAPIIERVGPAVVNIQVESAVQRGGETTNPEIPEFFKRFFGEDFAKRYGMPAPEGTPRHAQGIGSGFIVDPAGFVVTNNHVAGKADKITVTLAGGEQYDAKLIGSDPKTDLALIKIDADRTFPHVSWGSSGQVRVGDWVVAVGSPFGLGNTVTAGIVSARGRSIGAGPYDDFLQIDASINRGNSGGPTFNMNGEVVGVNTAIYSPNGGSIGIGFAIPADLAKSVIAQIKEHGKVERGWLGVQIQGVSEDIASGLGMEGTKGALVSRVFENSPAAKAGVKQGDVVVAVDGQAIDKVRDLAIRIAAMNAGTRAEIEVWRDGDIRTIPVEVARMPENEQMAAVESGPSRTLVREDLGLRLSALDAEARQRLSLPREATGVLVTAVEAGGVAASKGMRPGDVIISIGNGKVSSPDEVAKAVDQARSGDRKAILMLVAREGQELFVALPLEKA